MKTTTTEKIVTPTPQPQMTQKEITERIAEARMLAREGFTESYRDFATDRKVYTRRRP